MKNVTTQPNFSDRKPYLDGAPAREAAAKAVKILYNTFDEVEKVSRKHIYKVGNAFYLYIVSSPAQLKFDSTIRGLMKQYGKLPFYVLFTRETDTYPAASFDTYYAKIRKVYTFKGGFSGCILGLKEFKKDYIIDTMCKVEKIPLGLARYKELGGGVSVESVLRDLGLSPKKVKEGKQLLTLINQ